jgi:uncharacterized metal-binding protein
MDREKTCRGEQQTTEGSAYETIKIESVKDVCPMCEDYATRNASKSVVVMSCEGACLRGEVARQAANMLCHSLAPGKTVRLCLGGAFTKDAGQRKLARDGQKVIAIEGCFLACASRMMKGAVPGLVPEVIVADELYDFPRHLFGIDEMSEDRIKSHAATVAKKVVQRL